MRRIPAMLAVLALLIMALGVPAFAQGPEGGNPGQGVPQTQEEHPSAGNSGLKPLPFGGTEPEAGFNNAPQGVVCTAPGSPFYDPTAPPCQQ
jgi:hypothetical protein